MSIKKLLSIIAISAIFVVGNITQSPVYADHKISSCDEKITVFTRIPEDRNNDGLDDMVYLRVCKAQWIRLSPQFFDVYCDKETRTLIYIEKKKRQQIYRVPELSCQAT